MFNLDKTVEILMNKVKSTIGSCFYKKIGNSLVNNMLDIIRYIYE